MFSKCVRKILSVVMSTVVQLDFTHANLDFACLQNNLVINAVQVLW